MNCLADTVTIIRYFSSTGRIGNKAREILIDISSGKNILYISVISMVEILYLSERKRIPLDLKTFQEQVDQLDNYHIVDLNSKIIDIAQSVKDLELFDRLIVATSKYLNAPLLTSDKRIRESKSVEVIWA